MSGFASGVYKVTFILSISCVCEACVCVSVVMLPVLAVTFEVRSVVVVFNA